MVDVPVLAGLRPDGSADPGTAQRAARAWLAGGLVALPTETVYGLAADAQDPQAVARIYRVKGRPARHPLIVHLADSLALAAWSAGADAHARALARAFWPGPLTVIVARSARAGDHVTGGQDTVALRCPGHPAALACLSALARVSGDPARGVAAPSANRFGRVSPTSAGDVLDELGALLDPRRDLVVDGGPSTVGVESTIVDCTGPWPRVLRPGAIGQHQIDRAVEAAGLGRPGSGPGPSPHGGGPRRDESPVGPSRGSDREASPAVRDRAELRAPGLLAAHYAPAADVVVLPAGRAPGGLGLDVAGLIALAEVPTPAGWTRLAAPGSVQGYAHDLYAGLRRADQLGLAVVVAVLPAGADPLTAAVADRLGRAAHEGAGHRSPTAGLS